MTVVQDGTTTLFGFGPLRCCQRLAKPWFIVLILGLANFINKMLLGGFIIVAVTSLEKRFNLSSKEMGLVVGADEIGSLIFLLPVGYLGGRGSKPRWIGGGMVLIGLGALLFALPHYTTGEYRYNNEDKSSLCQLTDNSTTSLTPESCDPADETLSNYKYVLILSMLLTGAGTAPLISVAVSYVDENVHPNKLPLNLGIIYALTFTGSALGYLVGGYFIGIYTDFDTIGQDSINITPDSEAWVGAWWIGPLIGAALSILCAIPVFGFPNRLPGWEDLDKLRNEEVQRGSSKELKETQAEKNSFKTLLVSLKSLMRNPSFICFNLAGASETFLIFGYVAFGLKYVESQFSFSAAEASFILGSMSVMSAATGAILSGYVVQRHQLKIPSIIKVCLGVSVISLFTYLSLLIRCEQKEFVGVSIDYQGNSFGSMNSKDNSDLRAECNTDCGCSFDRHEPVCSGDVIYANPCVAGCTVESSSKVYGNCSCVPSGEAKEGSCNAGCSLAYVAFPLIGISVLFQFFITTILITVIIRCVDESERSLGVSIYMVITRALGAIPGPVIFGAIMDYSCLFWLTPPCSYDAVCFYYDNETMGLILCGVCLGVQLLVIVLFCGALKWYKAPMESIEETIYVPNEKKAGELNIDILEDGNIDSSKLNGTTDSSQAAEKIKSRDSYGSIDHGIPNGRELDYVKRKS